MQREYGRKLYKISIDAGFTCPNRDGACGFGGCIFCSEGGSGDFAERGSAEDIAILSIATRPDCLKEEVLGLLSEINEKKPVWVELGLQTIHDDTAEFLNRGYRTEVYDDAVRQLNGAGIKVITHVILGLPGETKEDMHKTVQHVAEVHSWGIKLQLLQILKGTRLAEIYERNPFPVLSMEEYVELAAELLEDLPEDMVIHRLTGDGPKNLLIEPKWSADKKRVLNALKKLIGE